MSVKRVKKFYVAKLESIIIPSGEIDGFESESFVALSKHGETFDDRDSADNYCENNDSDPDLFVIEKWVKIK